MAASAVTAAILPGKTKDTKFEGSIDNATRLSQSGVGGGGGVFSCVPDNPFDGQFHCHITVGTVTTAGGTASDIVIVLTLGNTSDSIPGNGRDSTSKINEIQ